MMTCSECLDDIPDDQPYIALYAVGESDPLRFTGIVLCRDCLPSNHRDELMNDLDLAAKR